MESERHSGAAVNYRRGFRARKFAGASLGKKSDARTVDVRFRMLCYLKMAFANGAHFHLEHELWRKFSAATRRDAKIGNKGYTEKHIRERVAPGFRKYAAGYKFEEIRHGRSFAYRITREGHSLGTGTPRERLLGAIAKCARSGRPVHVGKEFLRKFCELTHLPPAAVLDAWHGIKKISGGKVRRRGVGEGRKIVFYPDRPAPAENLGSYPQTSAGFSSPTGRRDQNSGGASPPENGGSSAPAAPGEGPPPLEAGAQTAANPTERTAPPGIGPGVAGGNTAPQVTPQHSRPLARGALPPIKIGQSWVSGRSVRALAGWLAVAVLAREHEARFRVRWRFAHARNFAERSLRLGFGRAEVIAAYAAGVLRAHEDAAYAGDVIREPSAAVCYAWRQLVGEDGRGAHAEAVAARWAAFLAAPRRGRQDAGGAATRAGTGASGRETIARFKTADERARALAQLRSKVAPEPAREALPAITAGELAAHLRGRGLTLAQFNALSWPMKTAIVRAALRAKRGE